jgi:hypothetical protein
METILLPLAYVLIPGAMFGFFVWTLLEFP